MAEPPAEIGVRRPGVRPAVVVPVLAVLALVGGQLPSFSRQANLYVLAIGAILTWLGLSGLIRIPPPGARGAGKAAWVWAVPVAVFASIEMVNYALGSTHAHPTISILLDPLFAGELARSVLYLGWLAVFWALVRR